MSLLPLYQQKTIGNYENFLAKDLKDQCIGMNIKQKMRIKSQQTTIDIFGIQNLLKNSLFWLIQIKMKMLKGTKSEGVICKKVLSRIITSSSVERTFMTNQLTLI